MKRYSLRLDIREVQLEAATIYHAIPTGTGKIKRLTFPYFGQNAEQLRLWHTVNEAKMAHLGRLLGDFLER